MFKENKVKEKNMYFTLLTIKLTPNTKPLCLGLVFSRKLNVKLLWKLTYDWIGDYESDIYETAFVLFKQTLEIIFKNQWWQRWRNVKAANVIVSQQIINIYTLTFKACTCIRIFKWHITLHWLTSAYLQHINKTQRVIYILFSLH